jgi:hypothetical protein
MAEAAHLMVARKKRERRGSRLQISSSSAHCWLSNLFPLCPTFYWFYHLQITQSAKEQAFNTWKFEGHLKSKP